MLLYLSLRRRLLMPLDISISQLVNLIKSGYRSNAFAPYVWFLGVIAIVSFILMYFIPDEFIRRILAVVLVAAMLFGMFMYYTLFKKDPRLLQSESFRLEDKKLDMISQKGSDFPILPVDLTTPIQSLNEGGKSE